MFIDVKSNPNKFRMSYSKFFYKDSIKGLEKFSKRLLLFLKGFLTF